MFRTLEEMLASSQSNQIITGNALLLLEAEHNLSLQKACATASLVLPESAGIAWALRRRGVQDFYRIAGIDLAFQLCEMAAKSGKSVFLIGGKPGVSEAVARHLISRIPKLDIAGTLDGFFNILQDTVITNAIRDSGAALCLVAMGMPLQDIWIAGRRSLLPKTLCMGVGGSFDVWAGNVKRAPAWFQQRGLEWLYRFYQEPHRWPRMAQLPLFALKVLTKRRRYS